ncbi:MAG: ABC transporter permease [Tissierellia bacterium]|nr:ABC transporter permease [Tissierellia bacterium]
MERIIIDGLQFALPLFIMAIGGIYSERSGITNLCLEGLQGFGAFFGALAIALIGINNPSLVQANGFYIAIIFAMIGGMLFSLLHAILSIKYRANQVVSGIVVNLLAVSLTEFLTRQINSTVFGAPSNKFQLGVLPRHNIPVLSEIPLIGAFFKEIYPFQIIILIVAVLAWILFYKTRLGLRLRSLGDNPHAADSQGVNVEGIRYFAVMVSGALSGLAGISFAYSISANFSPAIFMGFGYLSITALIFGNWEIGPTFFATLLFGFARSGGYALAKALKMEAAFTDITMTLPYILTLLLLLFFSKNNRSPRALGEPFDKGKR